MALFSLRKKLGGSSIAFLIGMAISSVFYAIVHMPFMRDSILHAYTTHHATEYAIVLLFFWANAEHLICYLKGTREKFAIRCISLPDHYGLEDVSRVGELLDGLHLDHCTHSQSMMYQKLQSALKFVHERRSADGFREYLESL